MSRHRRSLVYLSTALVVLLASVFLFGQKVYAQEAPLPLKVSEQIIEEKSQVLAEKSSELKITSQEIANLEAKKQELASVLENEKKVIDDLANKLAEKKAAAEAEKKRLAEIRNMFVKVTRYSGDSSGNLYTPGNCTWYAKSMRPDLPNNLGNANTWYSRAAAQGWNVGLTPKKGAVATTTSGWAGHVAYVIGVSLDGQEVTIREMNYRGLYSMNTRTVHYTEFRYIYELE